MTDKKNTRQEREEDATRELLDAYCKLVTLTASDVSVGRKSEALNKIVSAMTEAQAKAMLTVRIAVDSLLSNETIERLSDAPLDSLGEKPTLH